MKTSDIRKQLSDKYLAGDFRENGTIEIQNAHFEADKDFIVPFFIFKSDWSDGWYAKYYTPIVDKQFDYIVKKLNNNKSDRQAVICMASQNEHESLGYICTIYIQMFINSDKLDWIVNMRSNDIMRYPHDFRWNMQIQKRFCTALNLNPGKIFWNVGSLHCYLKDCKYL